MINIYNRQIIIAQATKLKQFWTKEDKENMLGMKQGALNMSL